MNIYVTVVLLSMIGSAWSNICCVPPQWEGEEGIFTGLVMNETGKIETGLIKVSYDMTNNRIYTESNIEFNGVKSTSRVIQDYTKKIQYTTAYNQCTKTPLVNFPTGCIPDGIEVVRTSYYGFGDNRLKATTYKIVKGGMTVYATMTNMCIPVAEAVYGSTNGMPFVQTVGFQGITEGIHNLSVFNVPSICDNVPVLHLPVQESASIFSMR